MACRTSPSSQPAPTTAATSVAETKPVPEQPSLDDLAGARMDASFKVSDLADRGGVDVDGIAGRQIGDTFFGLVTEKSQAGTSENVRLLFVGFNPANKRVLDVELDRWESDPDATAEPRAVTSAAFGSFSGSGEIELAIVITDATLLRSRVPIGSLPQTERQSNANSLCGCDHCDEHRKTARLLVVNQKGETIVSRDLGSWTDCASHRYYDARTAFPVTADRDGFVLVRAEQLNGDYNPIENLHLVELDEGRPVTFRYVAFDELNSTGESVFEFIGHTSAGPRTFEFETELGAIRVSGR